MHTLYLYGLQQIIILLLSEYKTRWFAAILYMLKWFAGHQIRNVGVSFFSGHLTILFYLAYIMFILMTSYRSESLPREKD